jgi:hypothetical protein
MSETVTYPAPVVDWPPPPRDKGEREYRAFLRMLPELLREYHGKYVAVHDEQVVDSGDDELALASCVWAKYGYVPIHIGLVTEQPLRPVRIPSFHVLSSEKAQ